MLAKLVDPDVAKALQDQFPEIALERREARQYPAGTLAANVVGAAPGTPPTSGKLTGRVGLESSQDNLLAGSDGCARSTRPRAAAPIIPGSVRYERPAVPGSTLQLTLDSDLQYTVQRELTAYVAKTGAKDNSSAVVLDAAHRQGAARWPTGTTFDPSNPGASPCQTQLGNAAVTTPYEPGSVNKIVTMSAAIEYGVAQPDDVLDVPGQHQGRRPHDQRRLGARAAALHAHRRAGEVVERRHDHDGRRRWGSERFADMLARFGLGQTHRRRAARGERRAACRRARRGPGRRSATSPSARACR